MSSSSYSARNNIEKEIEYLGRRLDKYAKFYWRGEDMWATYNTFITNNGSALKFVNGPSFSNEYSSPQYDHAMGNLTGVKFTRMQVSFSICTYGVTVEKYRSLIAALGPYEIDYLAFDYDDKLCYLAKTTGMKEGTKTVIGVNSEGKDLYMVENNITFEVQGEQCALAQRQYVWTTSQRDPASDGQGNEIVMLEAAINQNDMLSKSELPFGIVSEIRFQPKNTTTEGELELYLKDDSGKKISLCDIVFNRITENWQNTSSNNASSFQSIDNTFLVKYDSSSGLVFLSYGETDYKILNLLLTNTYGEYLIKSMATQKIKIDKNENVENIKLYWRLKNLDYIYNIRDVLTISFDSREDSWSYLKTISINDIQYTFGEDGTYRNIPGLFISDRADPFDDGEYTKFYVYGQIRIPIDINSVVSVTAKEGTVLRYHTDSLPLVETIMEFTQEQDKELSLDYDQHIDTTTIQSYGRAKAILI